MDKFIWVPVIIVLIAACFSLGSKGALHKHNTSHLTIGFIVVIVIAAACVMTWGIN